MSGGAVAIFIPHLGCPCLCSFCNQRIISGEQSAPTAAEVRKTLEDAKKHLKERCENTEIAFFGGSFTAIERGYMIELLETASEFIGEDGFFGVRISTRPDCIDDEVLTLLKSYNVRTIELGVQSLDDTVLLKNNRGHTAKQSIEAAKLIKSYGFSLVFQLMCGLFSDSEESIIKTAEQTVMINPDGVRIYPVITLRGTELEQLYIEKKYKPLSIEEAVVISLKLKRIFNEANIPIVKMGLHASTDIEENLVAGPYHSAFSQLVSSLEIYEDIKIALGGRKSGTVYINPRKLSDLYGQKKQNLQKFIIDGIELKIVVSEDTDSYRLV